MVHCAVDSMLSHDSPLSRKYDTRLPYMNANRVGKRDAVARFVTPSERNIVVSKCRSQRLARRFELERERRARRHSSARAPRPQPPHPSTNMSPVTTRTSLASRPPSEDGPAKVRRARTRRLPASSPVARSPSLPASAPVARARPIARGAETDATRALHAPWHLSLACAHGVAPPRCVLPPRAATRAAAASRVSKRPPFVVARRL